MPARPFFITGLPRSRTAWLSVYMTTGRAVCYHDACAKIERIEDVEAVFASDFYHYVGIADSALGFYLPWILQNIGPRTLIVERDPDEVSNSLAALGMPKTKLPNRLLASLKEFRGHPLVMWVPYRLLDEKRVMEKAFLHLLPGEAFDERRHDEMAKLNIQTDMRKAVASYLANRPQMDRLMQQAIGVSDAVH
jgi:hypothetical protein